MSIKITLPDKSVKEFDQEITMKDLAYSIGQGLGKVAIAGIVNGKVVDLMHMIRENSEVSIITRTSPEGIDILRHSTAHVLAQAVKRLYPNVKLAIGPTVEDKFYYDFDFEENLSINDFGKIEEEMHNIIKEDLTIERFELPRAEAIALFEKLDETYKVELIQDLPDEHVSLYRQGEFTDLCRGPHLPSTGMIKAFKLLTLAGAYWRGSEANPMLQRVYGTAFPTKANLEEYLVRIEEAKRRDHRKIGKEQNLYSFNEAGPGFPFFHPKGVILWNELLKFWRELHYASDYQEIMTPMILNSELWHRSGHWDHYRENMYFTTIDDEVCAIKPMNCPGGVLVYKAEKHSYRELPLRYAEIGMVHRHELSGVLHGLLRVRSFHIDDAHIFMMPSQIEDEVVGVVELAQKIYNVFGFKYYVELSTRPENSMGSDEIWEKATNALQTVLDKKEIPYRINEGDGAFYGPKIDFHVEDCLGRTWQLGTVQLDFQMPERFDLVYAGSDGNDHRPVMVHRALFGAVERLIGILVEHYGGAFPVWLAPTQVTVIPVFPDSKYAQEVFGALKAMHIRTELDDRDDKVGYKIRQAQKEQVPYMLVVGEKEEADRTVAVRHRRQGDLGSMDPNDFIARIQNEIAQRE